MNAKQLFELDKKGGLIRTLVTLPTSQINKQNNNKINDQTSDIYIIWIKNKILKSQYINIESNDKINQLITLKLNEKIKWLINYQKDKICQII